MISKVIDTSATMYRLRRSRHVRDLRWIARVTLLAAVAAVGAAAYLKYVTHCGDTGPQGCDYVTAVKGLEDLLIYVGPVLAVCGAILAWVYQQGSARLGIVDLFGSEITTLCRATTILDYAKRVTEEFLVEPLETKAAAPAEPRKFSSEEDYFPIFNSNAKELQVLEARVVTHITAFYTYMKATRDSLRSLAEIPHLPHDSHKDGKWHTAMRNMIYMLFLAFESARKAVRDLVEYQPEKDERMITILLTELVCYGFLMKQFDAADVRYQRLRLRHEQYDEVVTQLCLEVDKEVNNAKKEFQEAKSIEQKKAKYERYADWLKAHRLLPELLERARPCDLTSICNVQIDPGSVRTMTE